jgi:hypothetical protein
LRSGEIGVAPLQRHHALIVNARNQITKGGA